MGRSQGKNKTAKILIGEGDGSFKATFRPKQVGVQTEDLKDDNIRQELVPSKVLHNQIGVTVYWSGNRDDLLEVLYYGNEVASKKTNKHVVDDLEEAVEEGGNLLGWAADSGLEKNLDFAYPGEKMKPMPKSDSHGLFLSAVLDFDPNNLDKDLLESFSQEAREVLFSNQPIKDKLSQLKKLLYPSRFYQVLAQMSKPLENDPLKIAFRKNS
jgi:hypothetical protein